MSYIELHLLSQLQNSDPIMHDAIAEEQWDVAASRWNTFLQQCHGDPFLRDSVRHHLHRVHSEVIRAGVTANMKRREQEVENDIIALKASHVSIDWNPVSASKVPFSTYEDDVLATLVKSHTNKRSKCKINWVNITSVWLAQYHAEVDAGQVNRLRPRAKDTLKAHWQTVRQAQLQRLAGGNSTPAAPPINTPANSSSSSSTTVSTMPSAPLPLIPLPSVSTPSDLTPSSLAAAATSPSPPAAAAPVSPEGVVSVSSSPSAVASRIAEVASTAAHCVRQLFSSQFTPSTVTSATPDAPPPSSTSSTPHTARAGGTSPSHKWHWAEDATRHFNELLDQRNYHWSYEEFAALWPTHLYGHVDRIRWSNKNKTEKKKREEAKTGGGGGGKRSLAKDGRKADGNGQKRVRVS